MLLYQTFTTAKVKIKLLYLFIKLLNAKLLTPYFSAEIFIFKVQLSPSKKKLCYLLHRKPSFCHDSLVMQEEWLDQKDKINCKICDITTWLTNNYHTHIAQYPTNYTQNEAGRLVPDLFIFQKSLICMQLNFNMF